MQISVVFHVEHCKCITGQIYTWLTCIILLDVTGLVGVSVIVGAFRYSIVSQGNKHSAVCRVMGNGWISNVLIFDGGVDAVGEFAIDNLSPFVGWYWASEQAPDDYIRDNKSTTSLVSLELRRTHHSWW